MRVENLKRKTGLTRKQIELLALIYSLSKTRGYCYASKQDMARWLNMSETDIYNQLNSLQKEGFIKREKPHKNKIIVQHQMLEKFCQEKASWLIELNESHLYINMPYCFFALADVSQEEFIDYCERHKDDKFEKPSLEDSIPEWIKALHLDLDNDEGNNAD